MKMAGGNRTLAAKALMIGPISLAFKIDSDPQLSALYGGVSKGKELQPLEKIDVMLRDQQDLPEATIPNEALGNMVEQTELIIRARQEANGAAPSTMKKLRSFDALNIRPGDFLAQSLKDTHAILYDQMLRLDERADAIKKKYLDEGAEIAVDEMTRMFWQRAHTEIIKEIESIYGTLMAGTQAMIAMKKGSDKGAKGSGPKPGWGPKKSG